MLSEWERHEIRQEVYKDLADMNDEVMRHQAGSYRFLCFVDGDLVFTHTPYGRIIRRFH
jgi:hypothetical protein